MINVMKDTDYKSNVDQINWELDLFVIFRKFQFHEYKLIP